MPTVRIDFPPAGPPVTTPPTAISMKSGLSSSTGPSESEPARLNRERTAPATPATNSSPKGLRESSSAASRSITSPEAPESTRKRPGEGLPSIRGLTRRWPEVDHQAGTSLMALLEGAAAAAAEAEAEAEAEEEEEETEGFPVE